MLASAYIQRYVFASTDALLRAVGQHDPEQRRQHELVRACTCVHYRTRGLCVVADG
jgi:hypothetical protein